MNRGEFQTRAEFSDKPQPTSEEVLRKKRSVESKTRASIDELYKACGLSDVERIQAQDTIISPTIVVASNNKEGSGFLVAHVAITDGCGEINYSVVDRIPSDPVDVAENTGKKISSQSTDIDANAPDTSTAMHVVEGYESSLGLVMESAIDPELNPNFDFGEESS